MKKNIWLLNGALSFCFFVLITLSAAFAVNAATLTVTTTADNNFAGTLRNQIAAASTNTVDTIVFNFQPNDAGCVNNVCTIRVTTPIVFNKSLIIQGNGADRLVISGGNTTGLMRIGLPGSNIDVSISGIRFSNGRGGASGPSGLHFISFGSLTLSDSIISDNVYNAAGASGAGLFVEAGTVLITNCIFRNNSATSNSNGAASRAFGGALFTEDVTTIRNSEFTGNSVSATSQQASGGAIYSTNQLTISDSTIANNTVTASQLASGGGLTLTHSGDLTRVRVTGNNVVSNGGSAAGGGIANFSALMTIVDSTIDNNEVRSTTSVFSAGGGLSFSSTVNGVVTASISGSTISNNRVRNDGSALTLGGGIRQSHAIVPSSLSITNSTIAYNSTNLNNGSRGGGIHSEGTVTLNNSTITANESQTGGGLVSDRATFDIRNSLVALNTADSFLDVDGTFRSGGYNLIGRRDGSNGLNDPTDITGTNSSPRVPGLETDALGAPVLANNGGLTKTVALVAGSPAIDKGAAQTGVVSDQRGIDRPQDDAAIFPANGGNESDIGAFEADQCGGTVVTNTSNSGVGSLRCAISSARDGDTITFDAAVFQTPQLISIQTPLVVNKSVTINGPGANLLTIQTSLSVRIFNIGLGAREIDVTLKGLTIANGISSISVQNPNPWGGGIYFAAPGGSLTIIESVIRNCRATTNAVNVDARGGAVYSSSSGTLNIYRSTIHSNQATVTGLGALASGGGIATLGNGDVNLENVTITGNTATTAGGGMSHGFNNNTGKLRIISSTIVRNTANAAGGLFTTDTGSALTEFGNTILALNTGTASTRDGSGVVVSLGGNLFGNITNAFVQNTVDSDQRGSSSSPIDPLMGTLGSFGGPTPTIPLNAGSPAIDRGASFGLVSDQTGNARTIDTPGVANSSLDPTDIGAAERNSSENCTSNRNDGLWSSPATWNCAGIPTVTDHVVIRSGQFVIVDVEPRAASITINPGATLGVAGEFSFSFPIIVRDGGVLDLTSEKLFTGGNLVSLAPNAIVTGTGGYIIGPVRKTFSGPTAQFVFPIGTNNLYSPVDLANVPGPGTLTVSATEGPHPSPGLAPGKLRRFWTITNGSPGIVSADVSFNYDGIDVPSTMNPNDYNIIRLTGNSPEVVAGTFDPFNPRFTVPGLARFSDWTLGNIVPTSAGATISGRLVTGQGNGISGASVTLTDINGVTTSIRTGTFGAYRFEGVRSGETYTVTVGSRRFQFTPPTRVITVADDVTDLNFVADER